MSAHLYKTLPLLLLSLLVNNYYVACQYSGIFQGAMSSQDHGVNGDVYIADKNHFIVKNFHYDGSAPDAYFWVGHTVRPDSRGSIAQLTTNPGVLGKYSGQDVVVRLPSNYKMSDVKSLSVWCKKFAVNFGDIAIDGSNVPTLTNIGRFLPGNPSGTVSSGIILMDTKTIKVVNFQYVGQDQNNYNSYFIVGKGQISARGIKVPIKGKKLEPLPKFTGENVTLELPGDLTVFDIAYLSVYSFSLGQSLNQVIFPEPKTIAVPVFMKQEDGGATDMNLPCRTVIDDKDNGMNVYWKKDGDYIFITLEGKVGEQQYMAFGRSGSPTAAVMVDSDVAIVYTREGKVIADDYFISLKAPCTGVNGVCRDFNQGGQTNIEVVKSEYRNSILKVTYKRKMIAEEKFDGDFNTIGDTSVVAAIGGVDDRGQIKYHAGLVTNGAAVKIDFNKDDSTCKPLTSSEQTEDVKGWAPSKITDKNVFRVQLGVTGGKKGYQAITKTEGWGLAFYVNGLLIPEIYVKRGTEYTFIVEAGNDKKNDARYHPLYITTDKDGGIGAPGNTVSGVIAGVKKNAQGNYVPTAGRLCKWEARPGKEESWRTANSFAEYKKNLVLNCEVGQPNGFTWTPDSTVPDLVYYQCWIHKNLGWKIHVTGAAPLLSRSVLLTLSTCLAAMFLV